MSFDCDSAFLYFTKILNYLFIYTHFIIFFFFFLDSDEREMYWSYNDVYWNTNLRNCIHVFQSFKNDGKNENWCRSLVSQVSALSARNNFHYSAAYRVKKKKNKNLPGQTWLLSKNYLYFFIHSYNMFNKIHKFVIDFMLTYTLTLQCNCKIYEWVFYWYP